MRKLILVGAALLVLLVLLYGCGSSSDSGSIQQNSHKKLSSVKGWWYHEETHEHQYEGFEVETIHHFYGNPKHEKPPIRFVVNGNWIRLKKDPRAKVVGAELAYGQISELPPGLIGSHEYPLWDGKGAVPLVKDMGMGHTVELREIYVEVDDPRFPQRYTPNTYQGVVDVPPGIEVG